MNQALALFVLETVGMLDEEAEDYALDLLTLVEATLEDPRAILYKQIDRLRGELVAKLKAEGVDYEERKEKAEAVEHPKPKADFIYETFNAFADSHPWVGAENIRPKSVAREIYEGCYEFNDYVRFYGLSRSEGVVLRYLSRGYKATVQTVPVSSWDPEFENILAYLHGLLKRTDDSLIKEWELLSAEPTERDVLVSTSPEEDSDEPEIPDPLADKRAFKARVRNELHLLLKNLAHRDYEAACGAVRHGKSTAWRPEDFQEALEPYFEQHDYMDLTPRARQTQNTVFVEETPRVFQVFQKIVDPEGEVDWAIHASVDLSEWPPSNASAADPAAQDEGPPPWDLNAPLIEVRRVGI